MGKGRKSTNLCINQASNENGISISTLPAIIKSDYQLLRTDYFIYIGDVFE